MIYIRRIIGKSMTPTFQPGNIVLAWRWGQKKPGTIVVAEVQGREVIKRLQDIRGRLVYLVGDNPAVSTDSRHYGWVPKSAIKGVIVGARET